MKDVCFICGEEIEQSKTDPCAVTISRRPLRCLVILTACVTGINPTHARSARAILEMTEHLPDNSIQPQFGGSLQPDGSEADGARPTFSPSYCAEAGEWLWCWRIGAWMLKQSPCMKCTRRRPPTYTKPGDLSSFAIVRIKQPISSLVGNRSLNVQFTEKKPSVIFDRSRQTVKSSMFSGFLEKCHAVNCAWYDLTPWRHPVHSTANVQIPSLAFQFQRWVEGQKVASPEGTAAAYLSRRTKWPVRGPTGGRGSRSNSTPIPSAVPSGLVCWT